MADRGKQYLEALQEAINNDNADDVIDIATQLLNFLHDDPDILATRAIGYINNGDFELAFADLEKVKGYDFERIYCLYCLKRYNEALKAINALPATVSSEERYLHLKGQILFSLDQGQQCYDLYKQMLNEESTFEELVNISASMALCGKGKEAIKLVNEKESEVQQVYNTAIALYEAGEFEECDRMIELGNELAARAAEEAEEEEVQEGEEKSERYLSVEEQMLKLLRADLIAQNNQQEATAIFDEISDCEKAHPYARQVASSNYIALNIDAGNATILKKKVSQFEDNQQFPTLRKVEQEAFLTNRVLVYGKSSKANRLIQLARESSKVDPLVLEAFCRLYDIQIPNSENAPIFDAQALISQSKFTEAAQVLMKSSFAKKPRCITVITELFKADQKPEESIKYLHSLGINDANFLSFAVQYAFDNKFYQDASKWAEQNTKASSNSPLSQALLALSLSETDIEMAERYAGRLKVSFEGINVDELESNALQGVEKTVEGNQGEFAITGKKKKRPIEQLSAEKQEKRRAKHRRRRRLQLPLNYDKARTPNPARWQKKRKVKKAKKQPAPKMGKVGLTVSQVPQQAQPTSAIAAAAAKQAQKKKGKKGGKGKKSNW